MITYSRKTALPLMNQTYCSFKFIISNQ